MSAKKVAIVSDAEAASAEVRAYESTLRRELTNAGATLVVDCAGADVVVVLHAASPANATFRDALAAFQKERKHVWVVPPVPWTTTNAQGSLLLVRRPGVHVLWRSVDLLASMGLAPPRQRAILREDPVEQAIVDALGAPAHRDRLASRTAIPMAKLTTALFRLMVDGVVKERLDGCYELVV